MTVLFLILAALTIAGTAAAMTLRNPIHCILALTVGLVGLAALFLQLSAQFLGFTQILVYVGAVAILAVFAIMMTRSAEPHPSGRPQPVLSSSWPLGCIVAGAAFAVLAWAIGAGTGSFTSTNRALTERSAAAVSAPVNQIGDVLMHRYVLPLEIMGLLLTAALIGAVILAMPVKRETP